ncbi:hypothetical protein [Xanthomonas hortorum]|nr:hypothetical protein [Xanthomonas hortorum]MCE4356272.1 hypothetical protein [Xanthomonas hortorum pv. pelargonii]MCM5526676.1 hypothetical protein [Xanthomonas hortorum pv. pelargonii]MCM5537786.1 hypothetical protein [Xanthomonas hortorum pv. pelargonii]MCM5541893.1 hypothetical protein [Xanthomonas hortorum pv. pelargonii]MCM5546812.1 hypothetical protein [Xanthomonas hortorum pv. pelargonii]
MALSDPIREAFRMRDPAQTLRDYAKGIEMSAYKEMQDRALAAVQPLQSVQDMLDGLSAHRFASQVSEISHFESLSAKALAPLQSFGAVGSKVEKLMARTESLSAYQRSYEASLNNSYMQNIERLRLGSVSADMLSESARRHEAMLWGANNHFADVVRRMSETSSLTQFGKIEWGERFSILAKLAGDADFLRWADDAVSPVIDRHVSDWLKSIEDATAESEQPKRLGRRRVAMPHAVVDFLADPQQRKDFLLLVLSLLLFIEGKLSAARADLEQSDLRKTQAHAMETMETTRDTAAEQTATQEKHIAHLTQVAESLHALVSYSHRYTIIAKVTALRMSPGGQKIGHFERGDEVLVLRTAGKWRLISAFDEEGNEIQGWVLNKHLSRME